MDGLGIGWIEIDVGYRDMDKDVIGRTICVLSVSVYGCGAMSMSYVFYTTTAPSQIGRYDMAE